MKKAGIRTIAIKEVIDITETVANLVAEVSPAVIEGIAFVSIPHTTAALILSENDKELREDLIRVAEQWLAGCRPFAHIRKNNPNTEAHVLSSFGGTSLAVAVSNGKLDLGTYQRILFLEMDGPKERTVKCLVAPVTSTH